MNNEIFPVDRLGFTARPKEVSNGYAENQIRGTLALRGTADRKLDGSSDWRELSACKDADPNIFFPEQDDRTAIKLAKAICDACQVREQCLEDAMVRREKHGIWGGKDEKERRRMYRQRRRTINQ